MSKDIDTKFKHIDDMFDKLQRQVLVKHLLI